MEYLGGTLPSDAPRVDLEELYHVVDGLAAGSRGVCFVGGLRAQVVPGPPDSDSEDPHQAGEAEEMLAVWDDRLRGVPCGRCEGLDREDDMCVCVTGVRGPTTETVVGPSPPETARGTVASAAVTSASTARRILLRTSSC